MKKKIVLFLAIIILVYSIGGICYIKFIYFDDSVKVNQNLDVIDEYEYSLKSNVSLLYKNEFKILKDNLNSDIDDEEYLKSVAKLYIIDLYSMNYKINKYDINTEFVYSSVVDNYVLNLQNTMYKYLEDNSDGDRNQILPEVKSIEVTEVQDVKYNLNEKELDAKKVSLKWDYVSDLGYNTEGEVTLVKQDNKYYVVEYK